MNKDHAQLNEEIKASQTESERWEVSADFDPVEPYLNACAELKHMTPGTKEYFRQIEVCQMLQVGKVYCEKCGEAFFERDLQYNSADQLVCKGCQDSYVFDIVSEILNVGQQIY